MSKKRDPQIVVDANLGAFMVALEEFGKEHGLTVDDVMLLSLSFCAQVVAHNLNDEKTN